MLGIRLPRCSNGAAAGYADFIAACRRSAAWDCRQLIGGQRLEGFFSEDQLLRIAFHGISPGFSPGEEGVVIDSEGAYSTWHADVGQRVSARKYLVPRS